MVKTSLSLDVETGMVDPLRELARELDDVDSALREYKLRESAVSTPWIARLMSEMGLLIDHASAMELFRERRDPPRSARIQKFRAQLLRVSALALAGIEWCDRGGCPDPQTT